MKYIICTFCIILCYLVQCFGNEVVINVLNYSFVGIDTDITKTFEMEFEEYAKENHLNITLEFETILTNPSESYAYYKSVVETSLKKSVNNNNDNKIDIYFYDLRFTNLYGSYLLDLKDELPKGYIDMYDQTIIEQSCTYKEKLVGLPVSATFDILYSNKDLLSKYNKTIPKTWNELIKTCQHILERENDPELICYNGLFDDSKLGLYSTYEFIYSCRDSYNSIYPNPKDQTFVNSLKMLKKLKEEIASDKIFRSNENFTFSKLMDNKFIFLKYFLVSEPLINMIQSFHHLSILPGIKEGISGTTIDGNNIGIVKNIAKNKKEAALEVIKFYTSKEYQRENFKSKKLITVLKDLWYDEEVCKNGLCDVLKNSQVIVNPEFIKDRKDDAWKKYQNSIYQYLFKNQTMDETLKQIYDLTKIYHVDLNTNNTYIGLICFIYIIIVSVLMSFSLIYLFRENFQPFFSFLSEDLWIVTVIGSILILSSQYFNYGPVSKLKCQLLPLSLSIGYTFNICPTLYALIINFPEDNKISKWVNNHRNLFLLFNILIDIFLWSTYLINEWSKEQIFNEKGEIFEICKFNGEYSITIMLFYKFLVILLMLLLIFVEWNISIIKYDLEFVVVALYVDILSILMICIFYIIKLKNYVSYFIIKVFIVSIVSLSNYTFLYGFRILLGTVKKQNLKLKFINKINEKFINNINTKQSESTDKHTSVYVTKTTLSNEENNPSSVLTDNSNFFRRMINYHYSKESYISSTTDSSTIDNN